MVGESAELLRLRKTTSDTVDAIFNEVRSQYSKALLSGAGDCDGFLSILNNASRAHVSLYNQVLRSAYEYGTKEGLKEVKSVYIYNNDTSSIPITNAKLSDLWHLTSDKVKTSFKDLADYIKKAVSKVKGKKSKATLKKVNDALDVAKNQTKVNLQDAITSAVSDGVLDSFELAGLNTVLAKIETVKDNRRCQRCSELEGKIYSIERVRGLLPVHPNCRCVWKLASKKGVKKEIVKEQQVQEQKVLKLRDRLNNKYKQKKAGKSVPVHVHNESPTISTFNSLRELVVPDKSFYVDLALENKARGSVHMLLSNIRGFGTAGRSGQRKQLLTVTNEAYRKRMKVADNGTMLIPAGLLLYVQSSNPKTGEVHLLGVGDGSGSLALYGGQTFAQEVWRKNLTNRIQTVPLLPYSLAEYPYRLASDINGTLSVIMTNPNMGYIDTGDSRHILHPYSDLLNYIIHHNLAII